jgi:hypothetical protein
MAFVKSVARVHVDNSGTWIEVPVLVSEAGILMPLLDYCVSSNRSISWMNKLIGAVGLFLEFLAANPNENEHWRLFRNFASKLYLGTFDTDSGLDPSYLCWEPRQAKAARDIQYLLTSFFDWLGETNVSAAKLNPRYAGTDFDRRIDQMAYLYRRNKAFLGHTWTTNPRKEDQKNGRLTRSRLEPKTADRCPPEFPAARFEELIFKGFRVGGKFDYRGMLITLLMHGAGFRACEPFHLYMCDVGISDDETPSALVRIHHPEFGVAPDDWLDEKGRARHGNRRAYLAARWGLSMRTRANGRTAAGWKDPLLDGDYYMRAWWFEPIYGVWFLKIWERYIKQAAKTDRDNPYAFVNLNRAPIGSLYKVSTFRTAHKAAVLRIGLPYGKEHGTTEHGHRHAYAQALRRGGVDPVFIRKFLHHKSIDSQAVYTAPTVEESLMALISATNQLRNIGHESISQSILSAAWAEDEYALTRSR